MQTIELYLYENRISQTEFADMVNQTPQRVYAWRKKGYLVDVKNGKIIVYKKVIDRLVR